MRLEHEAPEATWREVWCPAMEADWPLASIVFLASNRREALAVSLEQVLGHLDYPSERLEVIVADNASSDGTAEMVRERFPRVRIMRNAENVGASGWNHAMTCARGDWRLILDDDCYIAADALKTAVLRAQEHHADLVSFRVLSGEVPGYAFNDEYPTGLLSFWGCSAMFSRRAIETEPFYDPRMFIWANEMELTMRLLDRGFRHLYLPEVESVHMKGPNDKFVEHMMRVNYRHWGYIAGKHLQTLDAVGALANLLVHVLLQAWSEADAPSAAWPMFPGALWRVCAGARRSGPPSHASTAATVDTSSARSRSCAPRWIACAPVGIPRGRRGCDWPVTRAGMSATGASTQPRRPCSSCRGSELQRLGGRRVEACVLAPVLTQTLGLTGLTRTAAPCSHQVGWQPQQQLTRPAPDAQRRPEVEKVALVDARDLGAYGVATTQAPHEPSECRGQAPERPAVDAQRVAGDGGEHPGQRQGRIPWLHELAHYVREMSGVHEVGGRPDVLDGRRHSRLHVHGEHVGQMQVPEPAVEEAHRELDLVGPDEDLGVIATQRREHRTAHQHGTAPEREQARRIVLVEAEVGALRAHDAKGHQVGLVLSCGDNRPPQAVWRQVAVVVEREDVDALRHREPVVEATHS